MTRPVLDFWFDFASPLCHPAAMVIGRRAADAGVAVRWRPLAPGKAPALAEADWAAVEAACAAAGVAFRRPSVFPRDGRPAALAALACPAEGLDMAVFCRAVFDANFAHDHDIGDVSRLGEILAEIDMPGAAVLQQARAPETAAALGETAEAAARLGVAALPAFTAGGVRLEGFAELDAALALAARG